jgi:hypothetical protein
VPPPGCLRPEAWSRWTLTTACAHDRDLPGHPSLENTTHNAMVRSREAINLSQLTALKTDAVHVYEDRLQQPMITTVHNTLRHTDESIYNDIGLYDTSSITSYILWYHYNDGRAVA